jgi:hypothetical protein
MIFKSSEKALIICTVEYKAFMAKMAQKMRMNRQKKQLNKLLPRWVSLWKDSLRGLQRRSKKKKRRDKISKIEKKTQ